MALFSVHGSAVIKRGPVRNTVLAFFEMAENVLFTLIHINRSRISGLDLRVLLISGTIPSAGNIIDIARTFENLVLIRINAAHLGCRNRVLNRQTRLHQHIAEFCLVLLVGIHEADSRSNPGLRRAQVLCPPCVIRCGELSAFRAIRCKTAFKLRKLITCSGT